MRQQMRQDDVECLSSHESRATQSGIQSHVKRYNERYQDLLAVAIEKWASQRLVLPLLRGVEEVVQLHTYTARDFSLTFENLVGQSLAAWLSSPNYVFDEQAVRFVCHKMLQGIAAVHRCHFAHKNLSLRNTYLHYDKEHKQIFVKLLDFGFARDFNEGLENQEISPEHMKYKERRRQEQQDDSQHNYQPPESANEQTSPSEAYDMFALGVCLFRLVFKLNPCINDYTNRDNLYQYMIAEDYTTFWTNVRRAYLNRYNAHIMVSDRLLNLLTFLLANNAANRYSLDEAMCDPWVREPDSQMEYLWNVFNRQPNSA